MREVTHEEFYEVIGALNCKLTTNPPFPYTTEFKVNQKVVGEVRDSLKDGRIISSYYLKH